MKNFFLLIILSKPESVKIYSLSVKFDWFRYLKKRLLWISQISLITSVKYDWFNQWNDFPQIHLEKINWLNSENYLIYQWNVFSADETVKRHITDSDLESKINVAHGI